MSKFGNFMKGAGEVLSAMAEASRERKMLPIVKLADLSKNIDWENYQSTTVLYALTEKDYQTLQEAQNILNRFPKK